MRRLHLAEYARYAKGTPRVVFMLRAFYGKGESLGMGSSNAQGPNRHAGSALPFTRLPRAALLKAALLKRIGL